MTDEIKPKGVADTERVGFQAEAPSKGGRTLKVRRIGNSLGIVLPKEVLAKLRVGEGDELSVTEAPGGIALAAADGETNELIRLAEDIMRKRRKVLRALAQ
ncbi:MAG: AbrB/MazE/SpoVT family DNA-binding domain-containing protein [Terricaulis sp.]